MEGGIRNWQDVNKIQSGAAAAGCIKGFVIFFLEVPLACLDSLAAAVQPNGLWNSQKTCL